MRSYPEYPLNENYVLTVFWNRPDGCLARVYHVVRAEDDPEGVHNEIGMVITWFEKADLEQAEHWRAECYLREAHFSSELITSISTKLLSETKCRMPLSLMVNRFERIQGCRYEFVNDDASA